jgi:hypothetical protein
MNQNSSLHVAFSSILATTARLFTACCDLLLLKRASIELVTAKIQNPPAFVVKPRLADCCEPV